MPPEIAETAVGPQTLELTRIDIKDPTLKHKVVFLLGGTAFAVFTYIIGSLVYEAEIYISKTDVASRIDFAGAVPRIFQAHLLTFFPWVFGAMFLSFVLGNIFDRQVKFRQKAQELQTRAEALAVTDGLTLLYNHRYFIDQLALELKRSARQSYPFAVLFLDIDDFKKYNDKFGHLAGDDVLRNVAIATRASVRETDIVARYGGEEIVVIAIGSEKEQGTRLAERIRERIQRTCPVTVSIGVAGYPRDGKTVDQLIKAADGAMYGAKGFGKNRVCMVSDKAPPLQEALDESC